MIPLSWPTPSHSTFTSPQLQTAPQTVSQGKPVLPQVAPCQGFSQRIYNVNYKLNFKDELQVQTVK